MSFGTGAWTDHEVEKLIKRVESFEINSAHNKLKLDNLAQLKDYLLAHRKGKAVPGSGSSLTNRKRLA